jgi:hypothetical protein
MRDKSDRYQVEMVPALTPPKRLGSYLVDAGLLSLDQINVALNDQQATGMRFGEILVARGWLKEQTIEWVMKRVVEPERQQRRRQQIAQQPANRPRSLEVLRTAAADLAQDKAEEEPLKEPLKRPPLRRELPISKPLPSVKSSDSDVNWVG